MNENKKISLDTYLENFKSEKEEDKKTIYYIT